MPAQAHGTPPDDRRCGGATDPAPTSACGGLTTWIRSEGKFTLSDIISRLTERPAHGEDGQGLAEYALILGLIAITAIVSLVFLGDMIADLMSYIGSTIASNT